LRARLQLWSAASSLALSNRTESTPYVPETSREGTDARTRRIRLAEVLYQPGLLPGFPGPVPGPSLIGGFPGGCGSMPLPTPLFPLPPECAMAVEFKLVDKRSVIAGGVTTANLPHAVRNFRRSASEAASVTFSGMELSFRGGSPGRYPIIKKPAASNNI